MWMAHHFHKISLLSAPPTPKHTEPYFSMHLSNYFVTVYKPIFRTRLGASWRKKQNKTKLLFNSIFWESRIANRIKSKEQVPKNLCWMTFTTSIDTLRSEANSFRCCQSPRVEKWNTFLSTGENLINSWNPLFPWMPLLFCLTVPMI